ncbi:MAG TPA: hypothetical protein VG796_28455 [Verrucomicrobiales bacterium]|nr:hypothetical protein [Verrucomicrobiales bacterium]
MLEIRQDQMQMFVDNARNGFVARVVSYLKLHRAEHAKEDVAAMVRRQITAAEGYGIRSEAAVVKFTELCAVFGEDFHDSGKYPEVERILSQQADGAVKIEELCDAAERDFAAVA